MDELFAKHDLKPRTGLAQRIFNASAQGYTLFARNMTESAIEAVRAGRNIDLGDAPESLLGYAISELQRLESLEQWPDLSPLFVFLTFAREAVSVNELPRLIGKQIFPRALPAQLVRWLSVIEFPRRLKPALLSFAHPLLADVFGQALGYERDQTLADLCHTITAEPFHRWPNYAWRHLPQHMIHAGLSNQVKEMLMDADFIDARFAALGAELSPTVMAADWMAWYGTERRTVA